MPTSSNHVTIVIPNWNGLTWLKRCLPALEKQSHHHHDIIIVDNASDDDSLEWLAVQKENVKTIRLDKNYGFAYAVNRGIEVAQSPYIALLNNDTEPAIDWLEQLVAALESAPSNVLSAASCMISLDNPELIDDAGDFMNWAGDARKRGNNLPVANYQTPTYVMSACAGAACYKRSFFDQIGLLDEDFETYLEDVDIGIRAQLRGYKCIYVPSAKVLHKGHGSRLARPTYVEFVTSNRALIFVNNIPARLLLLNSMNLLRGQLMFFIAYRNWRASLKGYVRFFKLLPKALAKRRNNLPRIAISHSELQNLLTWPEDIGVPQ